ncbi:acylphosphatase [Patescibacteria group bacterium]|nr:acylphosphatase [Patescibacteria group bacterium]
MNKQVILKIYGRVQMVMFRDFVQRKAKKLDLLGWVRNQDDSAVKVVAEGEEKNLKELIDLCYNGSILSRVDKIEIEWREATGGFDKFKIQY